MEFFNPNVIGKPTTPEGHVGGNALLLLPYTYWNSSGKLFTFVSSELAQRASRPVHGLTKPDTFRKDASSCPTA